MVIANMRPREDARLRGGSLIEPFAIVLRQKKSRIDVNENALFSSERVKQNRESTNRVRVCEFRAHPVFNQLSSGFICVIRVWLPHLPAGIFYCLSLRKVITLQNLMCL